MQHHIASQFLAILKKELARNDIKITYRCQLTLTKQAVEQLLKFW